MTTSTNVHSNAETRDWKWGNSENTSLSWTTSGFDRGEW